MSTLFGTSQLENFKASLDARSQASVASAIERITEIKKRGGKVMVVTGSGPNIHEGVTTLIAELIRWALWTRFPPVPRSFPMKWQDH